MTPPKQQATEEEMRKAKIDLAFRDECAHLLIPLNDCRRQTAFLPFKCEHERHEVGFFYWFFFSVVVY